MMKSFARALLAGLALVALGCGPQDPKQKVDGMAASITPGTPISDVEAKYGKATDVVAAGKDRGGKPSGNRVYQFKSVDEKYDLWVNCDASNKVVWAMSSDKSIRMSPEGSPGGGGKGG